MALPKTCIVCNTITQGKDLDPAKSPLDRGHLFLWDEPNCFVLFCKPCWRKIERVVKRQEKDKP